MVRTATPAGASTSTNAKIKLVTRGILCVCVFAAVSLTANAQFKEVAPAPYSAAVARQKIRTSIGSVTPDNGPQTSDALSKLLVWYRDIVDDELIAAWKRDDRANLPALITPLADSRLALAIVEFSWRQQPAATFNLNYAPMLGDLMSRYQSSAEPFLRDLLEPAVPDLPQTAADAVCRILLDMPDTGTWRKTALQILPKYRPTAQALLTQDLRGSNQEKMYRAQFWMADLKLNVPAVTSDQRKAARQARAAPSPANRPRGCRKSKQRKSKHRQSTIVLTARPHIVDQCQPHRHQRHWGRAIQGPSTSAYTGTKVRHAVMQRQPRTAERAICLPWDADGEFTD